VHKVNSDFEWKSEQIIRQKSFLAALRYALDGACYGLQHERNMRRDFWAMNVILLFDLIVRPPFETVVWSIVAGAIVMAGELFNTALERVVDLTTDGELFLLAKIAKDTAAGAVLFLGIGALAIGLLLLKQSYPWRFELFSAKNPSGAVTAGAALCGLWLLQIRRWIWTRKNKSKCLTQ